MYLHPYLFKVYFSYSVMFVMVFTSKFAKWFTLGIFYTILYTVIMVGKSIQFMENSTTKVFFSFKSLLDQGPISGATATLYVGLRIAPPIIVSKSSGIHHDLHCFLYLLQKMIS